MKIQAIVAMSENRVIGINNQLPWHLPADLQHFKQITMGKPIIMGRKTYLSIGRPLPGRQNIVISRNPQFAAPGCDVFRSLSEGLAALQNQDEVFIIGGAQLFAEALPLIHQLYLTIIHHEFSGDVFFPNLKMTEWQEISREHHSPDEKNNHPYTFITLRRTPNI